MSWSCVSRPILNSISINIAANNGGDTRKATKLAGGFNIIPPMGLSSQERIKEMVVKQAAQVRERSRSRREKAQWPNIIGDDDDDANSHNKKWNLDEAYDQCLELASKDLSLVITNQDSESTFNSGLSFLIKTIFLLLGNLEHVRAISALAVWCRRTDEIVDGTNGYNNRLEILKRWEQRLYDTFEGRPSDIYDAALFDTITNYPVDIQLFKDMIDGMRIDVNKSRYENFDELYLYSYHVAGTAALMSIQVTGIAPQSKASLESVYESVVAFAVALQLTDILRDISEDARMGRIYLPLDELQSAGLSHDDILSERMSNKWRNFMRGQIKRARLYFKKGDKFIAELKPDDGWVCSWLSLMNIELLDNIEANGYSFKGDTSVGITKRLETLFLARAKTFANPFFNLV